jgi:two-component system response regulator MtrA
LRSDGYGTNPFTAAKRRLKSFRHVDGQQVRVLVVEDDALVRKAVRLTCETAGFLVHDEERGAAALAGLEAFRPDLVLLDLMLPDMTGFDVCREIRRGGHRMPVLILSARNEEIDVVLGLEIGADDYIQKPFRPRELLARIGAHLRKVKEGIPVEADGHGERLVFRGLTIDLPERKVTRGDSVLALTHTEFDLLAYLATNAGKALSRESIFNRVWGLRHPIETRVIDVHVRNIRRKIEDDPTRPAYILAVPGVGYRFAEVKP